jgi:hypothetical protein
MTGDPLRGVFIAGLGVAVDERAPDGELAERAPRVV